MSRTPLISIMLEAAKKASRQLIHDYNEISISPISPEKAANFAYHADALTEKIIVSELLNARSRFRYVKESGEIIGGDDDSNRFIVNPLDGVVNFLQGIPSFAISIGLERDRKPYAGIIYNPITEELFYGEKGYGAFHNNRRLKVTNVSNLSDAIIAAGLSGEKSKEMKELTGEQLKKVTINVGDIRRNGCTSLDLAYLAIGRYSGWWSNDTNPWEVCAGIAIIEEAGGKITTLSGEDIKLMDIKSMCASNNTIHNDLLNILK